ncbi:MAG: ribosomal protein S18-alanine N-acetyltransferase [bacterium]
MSVRRVDLDLRRSAPVMESVIRRMEESDLEEVLAIERVSFPSPWSQWAFRSEMQNPHSRPLVLTRAAAPCLIGYLCSWIILDECHILNLAVHPSLRRRGAASRMIDHLLRYCLEIGTSRYYLEVRVSNQHAITLYQKFGFHVCGVRRGYYSDTGEDAYIMHRGATCL